MGVKVSSRPSPSKPSKRMRAPGNVGSKADAPHQKGKHIVLAIVASTFEATRIKQLNVMKRKANTTRTRQQDSGSGNLLKVLK